MIFLTYYYDRDIFNGNKFQKWITDLFGDNVKFEGSEGRRFASISISLQDYEANKHKIPTKNLVKITGIFDILEQLVYGVRNFTNTIENEQFN